MDKEGVKMELKLSTLLLCLGVVIAVVVIAICIGG